MRPRAAVLTHPRAAPPQTMESSLKFQTRCVTCFLARDGFFVGTIEGRTSVQYFEQECASPRDLILRPLPWLTVRARIAANRKKNFTFRCHRIDNTRECYAVNGIKVHPVYGTFVTIGSDGTYNFWDKENRQKLKSSVRINQSISAAALNHNGSIFAYAASYDWHKVRCLAASPRPSPSIVAARPVPQAHGMCGDARPRTGLHFSPATLGKPDLFARLPGRRGQAEAGEPIGDARGSRCMRHRGHVPDGSWLRSSDATPVSARSLPAHSSVARRSRARPSATVRRRKSGRTARPACHAMGCAGA